jgi:hypothetical protein
VWPDRSAQPTTINRLPHWQRQSQTAALLRPLPVLSEPACDTTVSRQQRSPVMFLMRRSIALSFSPIGDQQNQGLDSLRCLLLRPIANRMRQRLLMFLAPNLIAQIDIAAAQGALLEMLGLASKRPAELPAHHGAAWPRFVDIHDGGHWGTLQTSSVGGKPFGERSAAVVQKLFLTSSGRKPCVEFPFCEYGLRKRVDVS